MALFDRAPLNWRYWRSFSLIAAGSMLDLFDFFIVGYLVAELGPQWHLTYGQSAIILLSGGVGAIISAPIWGCALRLLGTQAPARRRLSDLRRSAPA